MGFEYAQWKCDNCGAVAFMHDGNHDFQMGQLCRFVVATGRNRVNMPPYVQRVEEVLCKDCFEFHEKSWANNQRRQKSRTNTNNLISNLTP